IRLFLHSRENNIKIGGQPTGRFNFLYNLSKARGKYIALCEGDDYWTDPLKLQKQVEFLEENDGFTMCFTDYKVVNHSKILVKENPMEDHEKCHRTLCDILEGNLRLPRTNTVLFKNSALPKVFSEELSGAFNGDKVTFSMLTRKGLAGYLDFKSAYYRKHEGGINSLKSKLFKRQRLIETNKKLKKVFNKKNETDALDKQIINNLQILYHDMISVKDFCGVVFVSKQILVLNPLLLFKLYFKSLKAIIKQKFRQKRFQNKI
ncbi:MAG: hypothetical protein ACOCUL_05180, partial [Bacteroidota bacterium]